MTHDDGYRSQYVRSWRVGAELSAVVMRDRSPAHLVPTAIAGALADLVVPRPLDDHTRAICARIGNPAAFAAVRATLQQLADGGELWTSGQLLEAGAAPAAGDACDAPAELRSISFPTRHRAEQLARAVESYVVNARDHGAACEVVVADASTDAGSRERTCTRLRALARELGVEIAYSTLDDVERYAADLAAESGVDLGTVRFALLDTEAVGRAVGANRNVLLLHHVGEAFLSADDDTEARLAGPPSRREGLRLSSDSGEEAWFFPDRASAIAAATPWDGCLLRLHAEALGRQVHALLHEAAGRVQTGRLPGSMVRDLALRSGRVSLTFTGLYGDSGMGDPRSMMLSPETPTAARAMRSADEYRSATTSREMLKVAAGTTISRPASACMTTSLAFDHRSMLPPFCPVGIEDRIFGFTLARLPGRYSAHLPCAILHAAIGREYSSVFARHVGINDLIEPHIATWPFDAGVGSDESRLRGLGDILVAIGGATPADYAAQQRESVLQADERMAASLAALLARANGAPAYWVADVETRLSNVRLRARDDAYAVPVDLLREGRGPDEARAVGQRIVRKLGELFRAWPSIVAAARRLREKERRVAQRVG